MRLIDADAEITRIGQEIDRIEAKINRLKKLIEQEPLNTIHDFAEELKRCYRNKEDCRAEISTLANYMTAYDIGRVKEQLNEKAESYGDPASSDEGFRRYCRGIAAGFRYAVSIVEGGGLDGEDIADSFQRRNGSGHSGW